MSKDLRIDHSDDAIFLSYRWRSVSAWWLAFFATAWNGFLILLAFKVFTSATDQQVFKFVAFGSIHASIGAGLFYAALAYLCNYTRISVSADSILISHFPIYWGKIRKIETEHILKWELIEEVIRTESSQVEYVYRLVVCLDSGERKRLLLIESKKIAEQLIVNLGDTTGVEISFTESEKSFQKRAGHK